MAIPFDSLGRIALVSSVFGFIIYATVIETGILRQTLGGRILPRRSANCQQKPFSKRASLGLSAACLHRGVELTQRVSMFLIKHL